MYYKNAMYLCPWLYHSFLLCAALSIDLTDMSTHSSSLQRHNSQFTVKSRTRDY